VEPVNAVTKTYDEIMADIDAAIEDNTEKWNVLSRWALWPKFICVCVKSTDESQQTTSVSNSDAVKM
jgi:hypothetical protein